MKVEAVSTKVEAVGAWPRDDTGEKPIEMYPVLWNRRYPRQEEVKMETNATNVVDKIIGAVVMAQMVERLLQTPEILGSIPVIVKFYLLSTVLKRRK